MSLRMYWYALIGLSCLSLGMVGCGLGEGRENRVVLQGSTMGTTYTIKLIPPEIPGAGSVVSPETLRPEIDSLLDAINQQMSTYLVDSEISRFNRYSGTDWFEISSDLAQVLIRASEISVLSGGAFDVTVGPLVNLWGFGAGLKNSVASDPDIQETLATVGYQNIQVRSSPPAARKKTAGSGCDLSGIAKGFAVDRIAERLEAIGVEGYMVEIGGEVRCRRADGQQEPWRIGIQNPDAGERIQRVVQLHDGSMATSGDYHNYIERDGVRYSHTIDPATGKPVTHGLASVSVIHPSCMTADALATAISVMGPEKGFQFAVQQQLPVYLVIRQDDGLVYRTTPQMDFYLVKQQGGTR